MDAKKPARDGLYGNRRSGDSGLGFELERRGIHAVTHPRRLGAVRKDVAQVGVAGCAHHLGAAHPERVVGLLADVVRGHRRGERWPAGARLELGVRREEGRPAAHAAVGAGAVVVPELPGVGALGALLARDAELLARQLRLPFGIGFVHFVDHGVLVPCACVAPRGRRPFVRYSVAFPLFPYSRFPSRVSLEAAPADSFRRDVRVIGLISAAHAFSHFLQLALPPLFPLLRVEFDVSWTLLGLLVGVYYGASGVTQFAAGFAVDRLGARPVLLAGLGLAAGGTVVAALVPGAYWLFPVVALMGVGNGVFHPCDFAILNANVATRRLGYAYSTHGVGGNLGYAL